MSMSHGVSPCTSATNVSGLSASGEHKRPTSSEYCASTKLYDLSCRVKQVASRRRVPALPKRAGTQDVHHFPRRFPRIRRQISPISESRSPQPTVENIVQGADVSSLAHSQGLDTTPLVPVSLEPPSSGFPSSSTSSPLALPTTLPDSARSYHLSILDTSISLSSLMDFPSSMESSVFETEITSTDPLSTATPPAEISSSPTILSTFVPDTTVTEPATESTTEPTTEPATEPATEPTSISTTEPPPMSFSTTTITTASTAIIPPPSVSSFSQTFVSNIPETTESSIVPNFPAEETSMASETSAPLTSSFFSSSAPEATVDPTITSSSVTSIWTEPSDTVSEEISTSSEFESSSIIRSSSFPSYVPPSPRPSPFSTSSEEPSISSSVFTTLVPPPITSEPLTQSTAASSRRPRTTVTESRLTTITITQVYSSTYSGSVETTVTTVVETGVLRPLDVESGAQGLSDNVGAIIGVAVGSVVALLIAATLLFFVCRRYRRTGVDDNLEARTSWRPPFRDEEENGPHFLHSATAVASKLGRKFSSRNHIGGDEKYGHNDKVGSKASGNRSSEDKPLGGEMDQKMVEGAMSDENGSSPSDESTTVHGDVQNAPEVVAHPSSASVKASLHAQGSITPSLFFGSVPSRKRASLPGPRPIPVNQQSKRYSSNPLTSTMENTARGTGAADRGILSGLLGRLTKRSSVQSIATVRPRSPKLDLEIPNPFGSTDSLVDVPIDHNPPPTLASVERSPRVSLFHSDPDFYPTASSPQPILTFPRGVTGKSYGIHEAAQGSQPVLVPTPSLWPNFTLPPPPSPTDDSGSVIVKEGLLHPRLSVLSESHKASQTSFDDHEDYSRPIGGLCRHVKSTTTLDRESSVGSTG